MVRCSPHMRNPTIDEQAQKRGSTGCWIILILDCSINNAYFDTIKNKLFFQLFYITFLLFAIDVYFVNVNKNRLQNIEYQIFLNIGEDWGLS